MKLKNKTTQFMLATLLISTSAFAQTGGSVGGGNVTEGDLQYYINKLDTYLSSTEGKQTFPEIVAYDQAHPSETFHQIIQRTRPVVQKEELRDSFGQVRDCLSYMDQHYFVCNADTLPNKTLDNQPSFYRIVFHELLVQAGIEKPISKNIPSEYPVSSRITQNVHLETYQEWVPGTGKSNWAFERDLCVSFKSKKVCANVEPYQYRGMHQSDFTDGFMISSILEKDVWDRLTRVEVGNGVELCRAFLKALKVNSNDVVKSSIFLRFPKVDFSMNETYVIKGYKIQGAALYLHMIDSGHYRCDSEGLEKNKLPKWQLESLSCGYGTR